MADALTCIPSCHNHETVQSLFDDTIIGAVDRGEAEASEELLGEYKCLGNEVRVLATRIAAMHILDWGRSPRGGSHTDCLQKVALHSQGHTVSQERCIGKKILR